MKYILVLSILLLSACTQQSTICTATAKSGWNSYWTVPILAIKHQNDKVKLKARHYGWMDSTQFVSTTCNLNKN